METAREENASHSDSSRDLLRPIHILSCFAGNLKMQEYKALAYFGTILWFINICINFFFAFYESFTKIGTMSIVICSVFLLNCIVCTLSTNFRSAPWIDWGIHALSNDHFKRTLKKTSKTGKKLLLATPCISAVLTASNWLCSYYDSATDLQFARSLPNWSRFILGFLRLFSQFHVVLSYIIFWAIFAFSLVLIMSSMQDYKEYLRTCLLNKESSLTFREAVLTFNERARFVSKGSSAWMITSTALIIHSVSSFALGAYAFLYHERKLTYVFHALVPLLSAIYPMALAASVTKEYQSYVQDVVKAWVERPESNEEDEDIDDVHRQQQLRTPTSSATSRKRRLRAIWKSTTKAVEMLQMVRKRPKFQFEKYISYLQNVSPTTGFRVAGIVITWNKVSTLYFILFSIMAVFVQETIFGDAESTIS